eukprot:m.169104 g.169104  ORF g.169104 m.169104 type:complete len:112 (+) comp16471_c1_seq6:742-1077(+)
MATRISTELLHSPKLQSLRQSWLLVSDLQHLPGQISFLVEEGQHLQTSPICTTKQLWPMYERRMIVFIGERHHDIQCMNGLAFLVIRLSHFCVGCGLWQMPGLQAKERTKW